MTTLIVFYFGLQLLPFLNLFAICSEIITSERESRMNNASMKKVNRENVSLTASLNLGDFGRVGKRNLEMFTVVAFTNVRLPSR